MTTCAILLACILGLHLEIPRSKLVRVVKIKTNDGRNFDRIVYSVTKDVYHHQSILKIQNDSNILTLNEYSLKRSVPITNN